MVETAGIGQSDTEIVDLVDLSMYVMTADYGAASQLEKIDMLDFADFVVLNKFEKRGAEDALRDVRKQVARNRKLFKTPPEELPVYPDHREPVQRCGRQRAVRGAVRAAARAAGAPAALEAARASPRRPADAPGHHSGRARALPRGDRRGRAHGAAAARSKRPRPRAARTVSTARSRRSSDAALPAPLERLPASAALAAGDAAAADAATRRTTRRSTTIGAEGIALLREWPARREAAAADEFSYRVRGPRSARRRTTRESLSHLQAAEDRDAAATTTGARSSRSS